MDAGENGIILASFKNNTKSCFIVCTLYPTTMERERCITSRYLSREDICV